MLAPVPLDEPTANSVILSERSESKDLLAADPATIAPPDAPQNVPSPPESAHFADAVERPASLAQLQDMSSRPEPAHFAGAVERPVSSSATSQSPEDRARTVLATLATSTETTPETAEICDYLALFRRWYYRPEKQRTGEVFLPNPDATWPIRRILNGAARVVLGPPTAAPPVDREAFKDLKTKVIHEGREGVERVVPVLPKRARTRKAVTPAKLTDGNH
jgi:hypothetical protein